MTRLFGIALVALTLAIVLGASHAQDSVKKGNGKFDVEAIFKKLDTNDDGKLSKDEFLKLADRFKDKEKARANLAEVFTKIDTKMTGISRDQFRKYCESIRPKTDKN